MGFFSSIKELFKKERPVLAPAPQDAANAAVSAEWRTDLTLKLREADTRLSAWLGIVLEGVTKADDLFWQRLRFLLDALECPPAEADAFARSLADWLARMEYAQLEEFRSELQYRLALALELEDEEDERNRLFLKLSDSLARTREHFSRRLDALFAAHGELTEEFWEEMEEIFILADIGYDTATELIERLKSRARQGGVVRASEIRPLLRAEDRKSVV